MTRAGAAPPPGSVPLAVKKGHDAKLGRVPPVRGGEVAEPQQCRLHTTLQAAALGQSIFTSSQVAWLVSFSLEPKSMGMVLPIRLGR